MPQDPEPDPSVFPLDSFVSRLGEFSVSNVSRGLCFLFSLSPFLHRIAGSFLKGDLEKRGRQYLVANVPFSLRLTSLLVAIDAADSRESRAFTDTLRSSKGGGISFSAIVEKKRESLTMRGRKRVFSSEAAESAGCKSCHTEKC